MVEGAKVETFIGIEVRNPRTHISREKALYTDYEIVVKTNDIAFASNESSVRRRYSDFQWLRMRLINQYKLVTSPPELPPKRLFGRFQRQFLKRRQAGLQKFLERVVEDNQYLSDVAVHLFLQSSLPVKEIERYLDGMVSDGDILETLHSPNNRKTSGLSRSMAEIAQIEAPMEHDSGFCYSTTSSINDLMLSPVTKTEGNWRYYMSVPANLDKVAGSEMDLPTKEANEMQSGRLLQVDSGHLTNSSQQSLHRQALSSESDCDFSASFGYDADDESDTCFREGLFDSVDYVYHSKMFQIDQAMELLKSRPRISERVLVSDNDTDEEFHESEYDVIDSDSGDNLLRPRRKSSTSKKKLCRSVSDVKLRRRPSQTNSNRDVRSPRMSFQSMPDVPASLLKKTRRSSGSLHFKRLPVHKEDLEKIHVNFEGFTTSGSVGKCNKSDEADESFVPNSEVDCYSTWNTPTKLMNGNVDSSEVEASFDHHLELKPRTTSAARNLFKRIISKQEHRIYGDLVPTKISGRFKVSVIREEENVSRRGSCSSTELTLKMHPLEGVHKSKEDRQPGKPVAEPFPITDPPDLFEIDGVSPFLNSSLASLPELGKESCYLWKCVTNSENEKEQVLTAWEPVGQAPRQSCLADESSKMKWEVFDEPVVSIAHHSVAKHAEDTTSLETERALTSSVDKIVATATADRCEVVVRHDNMIEAVTVGHYDSVTSKEDEVRGTTENIHRDNRKGDGDSKFGSRDRSEAEVRRSELQEAADTAFSDFKSSEKLLNVCGISTYTRFSRPEKTRSVSPSPAILGTYDVIPDFATCALDDYEILCDKRE